MHRNSKEDAELREYFDLFLEAQMWTGKLNNNEPHKCDHLDWFDITALPEQTLPYVKAALAHKKAGTSFSSFGFD
jgi:hypothetical protein